MQPENIATPHVAGSRKSLYSKGLLALADCCQQCADTTLCVLTPAERRTDAQRQTSASNQAACPAQSGVLQRGDIEPRGTCSSR